MCLLKNSARKYVLMRFNFKSFYINLLNKNLKKIIKKAKIMNIIHNGIVSLPLKKRRFTVLRSPHIYKKSREQFEIKIYHRAFVILFNFSNEIDKKKAKLFINFIKNYCGGIQLKVTYKNLNKPSKTFIRKYENNLINGI